MAGCWKLTGTSALLITFVAAFHSGPANAAHLVCSGYNTTIDGTVLDDNISGTANRDVVRALSGQDNIQGWAGSDVLCGDDDWDWIEGHDGQDNLFGGGGTDDARGHDHDDFISGGPGDDDIRGGPSSDSLQGGDDTDWLFDSGGAYDTANGGSGFDYCEVGFESETSCENHF